MIIRINDVKGTPKTKKNLKTQINGKLMTQAVLMEINKKYPHEYLD
jgi:hypothetical protein